jgi:hypothetical protein
MQVVAHFNLNTDLIMKNHGLTGGGRVQQVIDSECLRYMQPYIPMETGVLASAATIGTVIGSGKITQNTPYARYLYYGELYVDPYTGKGCFYDPKTGRKWSRPKTQKVPSGRRLNYSTAVNPQAGSHWFQRMVKDHGDDIGRAAAAAGGGRFEK